MELCSIGHEEVCYESRFCPACAVKDELQAKIDEMQAKIDEMQEENDRWHSYKAVENSLMQKGKGQEDICG